MASIEVPRIQPRSQSEANNLPITYIPNAVSDADAYFDALMALPWSRKEGKMWGRTFLVPRDEIWVADYPYVYSKRTYEPRAWTPELIELRKIAAKHTGVEYDSVLLNRYLTGQDCVSWHCDCEDEMSGDHPIASISLGATRKFQVKAKSAGAKVHSLDLESGSILLMHAGMQQTWIHQVPKTSKEVGARINLTFRVMRRG